MASVMRGAFDSGTSLWQGARRSGADASTRERPNFLLLEIFTHGEA
jgi:hypothetical protein